MVYFNAWKESKLVKSFPPEIFFLDYPNFTVKSSELNVRILLILLSYFISFLINSEIFKVLKEWNVNKESCLFDLFDELLFNQFTRYNLSKTCLGNPIAWRVLEQIKCIDFKENQVKMVVKSEAHSVSSSFIICINTRNFNVNHNNLTCFV